MDSRTVFYVSDGTGITAETLAHSLLTQFATGHFREVRIPFVDTLEKAQKARARIDASGETDDRRPLVFNTVVDPQISAELAGSKGLVVDLFGQFLPVLEQELGETSARKIGRAHGIADTEKYEQRISAMNFALSHDDGVASSYDDAEVILLGVSRSGKTPTCLYLALHYGVRAANYPLTEDDLDGLSLPVFLRKHRNKLFGLTISAERLSQIRQQRRPDSRYASLKQCSREIGDAEAMFQSESVPWINTTTSSIEEIASKVLVTLGLEKHFY